MQLSAKNKHLIIKISAAAALIWVGWYFFTYPLLKEVASIRKMNAEAVSRSRLIEEIRDMERKVRAQERMLSDEENRYALLGKITTLANEQKFDVESLTPTVKPDKQYSKLTLGLNAEANFGSLIKFLDAVEKMETKFAVSKLIAINRLSQYKEKNIPQLEINLETYLKKGGKTA